MTATLTPPSSIHGSAPVSREPASSSSVTKAHPASKLRSLLSMRELPVIAALIALVLLTWVMNPRFLSAQGVRDLFLNATIAMLMAAGQSLIIQSEGVDLSVGSILGCTAFATGFLFAANPGLPIVVVFIAGIVLGGAARSTQWSARHAGESPRDGHHPGHALRLPRRTELVGGFHPVLRR